MKTGIFGAVCCLFFIVYFKILGFVYNRFVPMNTATDVLSIFIILFILIPCAVLSAYGCEKIIKSIKNK